MSGHESPYLKSEQRLADVIAAIQAMASNEYYERQSEHWAGIISGDNSKTKGAYWKAIFDDHGEFFRSRDGGQGAEGPKYYSLIARRALPHIDKTDKTTERVVYYAEYKKLTSGMSSDERRERFGRPRLPEAQLKVLIDVAVSLHTKAAEAGRWWFAPAAAFFASLLTAVFAFIAAWQFRK